MAEDKIAGWSGGINNMAGDKAVPNGFLRDCLNADARADGTISTRGGFTQLETGNCCGLYSMGDHGYYVANRQLFKLKDDVSTLIASGIGPYPAFAEVGAELLFSDGLDIYKVTSALSQLGAFATGATPGVSIGGGGLEPGYYTYGVFKSTADGDTGVIAVDSVLAPAGSSLSFSLPAGTTLAVSMCNGTILHRVAGSVVNSHADLLDALKTTNETRIPAGRFLFWWYGRLITANEDFVFFTEPLSKCMYRPNKGYAYIGKIRMMAPADGGIYVATADKTYLLAGKTPETWDLVEVFNYGAPYGHPIVHPKGKSGFWMSDRGLIRYSPEGASNVFDERGAYAIGPVGSAALLHKEEDGESTVLATLFDSEQATRAASNWASASITNEESLK